jgi:Crinkler effector protein N-terminal domain
VEYDRVIDVRLLIKPPQHSSLRHKMSFVTAPLCKSSMMRGLGHEHHPPTTVILDKTKETASNLGKQSSSNVKSLKLCCLVEGNYAPFPIEARGTWEVVELQKRIGQEVGDGPHLQGASYLDLELWKVHVPLKTASTSLHWQVDIDLSMFDLGPNDALSQYRFDVDDKAVTQLKTWHKLEKHWSCQPSDGRIHVIVKISTSA